jgi:hypothetical protein
MILAEGYWNLTQKQNKNHKILSINVTINKNNGAVLRAQMLLV